MSWSLRLGRVAGIPLYVHWTFLILLAWVGYRGWAASGDAATAAEGVLSVLALFGCVVLHELGHALAARRYGVPTADITLLPIGGVARLQRIPEHPGQELVVALAGPAVNLAIVAGLLAAGVRPPTAGSVLMPAVGGFWSQLLVVNVSLFAFNLLPAFPMDGGRVLRALLALRLDYAYATRLAASVGQFLAILFGLFGLTGGFPLLVLVALFVWIGAEGEARQVEVRSALEGSPVASAMLTDYRTLLPRDPLGHAAELLLAGSQQDFPVLDDGRPVGVLTRQDLLRGLAHGGRDAPVADYLTAELAIVEVDGPLIPAFARLREEGRTCLQVVDRGRPVGLLTAENIGEYLMIRSALKGNPAAAVAAADVG